MAGEWNVCGSVPSVQLGCGLVAFLGHERVRCAASRTPKCVNLLIEQARTIKQAFVRLRPDQQKAFQAGFDALERDLLDLDTRIRDIVSRNPKQPLVVSHPVYQYLTRRYGLNVKSLHWEPDELPNDNMWKELTEILASHPAKWMIWEGPPVAETVQKLKSLGVNSVVFDPCGNVPKQGDYLSVMRQNASNLALAFPQ